MTLQRSSSAPALPDYVLTDRIGAGTYATVYKAYKKVGNREVVAVKCVSKSSLNNRTKENLLTEIELLKTLQHEHIVSLKDFTWDDRYIYLILEHCSGGDLATFIRSRRILSESIVKRFLQQLGSALEYMHSMHVSHMDLKPSNILILSTSNPQLKIGDFGFAHYLIGDTEAEFLRGSLLYMAPEIIISRQYNEKADLWSVGVILYECLFGRAPFASKTMPELKVKILDTTPIEIPKSVSISDSCRDLVVGLLQRDPDKRMDFTEFLNHPFLDLQHRPCAESLPKAIALVARAVRADEESKFSEAIKLYCQSLEYFVPAIHYERDQRKKQALRQKVDEYMKRAEDLQQMTKPSLPPSNESSQVTRSEVKGQQKLGHVHLLSDELVTLFSDNSQVMSAIELISTAEYLESTDEYKGSLSYYEQALDILIKSIQNESEAKKKDLLQKQVCVWMTRAEEIKRYVLLKEDLTAQHAQIMRDQSITQQESDASASLLSTCSIQ